MGALGTNLLVMDETECDRTDVFALVGLVVPIEKADAIRLSLHRFVRDLENVPDRTIAEPPELHGSDMLPPEKAPWATDEHRIRCYEYAVGIVHEHSLQVLRAAYYKRSLEPIAKEQPEKIRRRMRYSLCFGGLEATVGALLGESYAIPIMDGMNNDLVVSLGSGKPTLHSYRASPFYQEGDLSIPNVQNLLDPVFVDSRYSSLMQVADVTAYLLHVLDWERQGLPITGDYKPRVAAAARKLDMSLVSGAEPIRMRMLKPSASP